jgi:hypothetical protein
MRRTSRTHVLAACMLAGCVLAGCSEMPSPPANSDLAVSADFAAAPVVADLAAWCPAPPSTNASINGHLPDGAFTGRFAWVGYLDGDCGNLPIVEVSGSAAPPSSSAPYLTVAWQSAPVLGEQTVRVLVVEPSGTLDVSGRLTLTQIEPAGSTAAVRLAGSLTVNELGGTLTLMGELSALHCAFLDSVCV